MTFLEQLHALHGALHLSHIPAALPGREEQHKSLRDFLSTHVDEARGGSLYVSGAPGTGKTASVEHVVHQLYGQRFHADAAVGSSAAAAAAASGPKSKTKLLSKLCASSPPVRSSSSAATGPLVVYTNAMAFASKPSALYPRLLAQMRGLSLEEEMALPSAMACMEELQQLFCPANAATVAPVPLKASSAANKNKGGSAKKKGARTGDGDETESISSNGGAASRMTLIVLDEVDALLRGPNAAVLYHLLEWPARPHSRLVVVAISNTINLLEQRLPELSRRNALPQTLLFTTYEAAQLKRIAQERCDSIYPPETVASAVTAAPAPVPAAPAAAEVAPADSPKKGTAPATPEKSPHKRSASAAASLSIASLSASKPAAPAPVLRSSPRTAPQSGPGRADVVVRSVRSRKRKQDDEGDQTGSAEDEATPLSAAADADAQPQSVVTIQPVPLRIDADPPSILDEAENVDPIGTDACVTPKKKRARGAALPRDSSAEAASATGAAAAASPSASPAAAASCPSSSPRASPASLSRTGTPPAVLIQASTRARPVFSDHALDLLCLKVSKGSGDLRKVLEVMRKCVDGLLVEAETIQILARHQAGAVASGAAADQPPSIPEDDEPAMDDAVASPRTPRTPSPSLFSSCTEHPSLQVSLPLMHGMVVSCMGGAGEQLGLLRSLPVQQKVLLSIGALLCHLHGGKEQLHAFPKYYARFSAHFKLEPLRGADFADLLAALAAHRLIKLERPAVRRRTGGAMGSGGGSGRSAPASGGGSGRSSKALGGGSGALGAIQVNVSLESLTAAFDGDPLMERLLSKGKALATSILAASRAASEIPHEDYVLRNVEDP